MPPQEMSVCQRSPYLHIIMIMTKFSRKQTVEEDTDADTDSSCMRSLMRQETLTNFFLHQLVLLADTKLAFTTLCAAQLSHFDDCDGFPKGSPRY